MARRRISDKPFFEPMVSLPIHLPIYATLGGDDLTHVNILHDALHMIRSLPNNNFKWKTGSSADLALIWLLSFV